MANVSFLKGSQSGIATLLANPSNITDGAFYLTTDSNRLYVGHGSGASAELRLLNQTVQIVASQSYLPGGTNNASGAKNKNDFFYVTDINALCIYDGTQWVQINPDDNNVVDEVVVTADATNGLVVKVCDDQNHDVSSTGLALSSDKGVSLDFTNGIKISGDQYAIASASAGANTNTATITLSSDASHNSDFDIKGGDNVTLSVDSSTGDITIKADDTTNASAAVTFANGKIGFSITDSAGTPTSAELENAISISYGHGTTKSSATLGSGNLDVYTASEMDAIINGLNGMTFKGTVGSSGTLTSGLPSSNVKIGDVYMVAGSQSLAAASSADGNAKSGKSGDLFVADVSASGKETNGVISEGLVWHFVPSGDDLTNTTYSASVADGSAKYDIKDDSNNSIGSIEIAAGTAMSVSGAVAENTNDLVVTVGHANVTCTETDKTSSNVIDDASSITAISEISVNAQGHVASYTKQKYNIKTYALQDASVSASSDVATVSIAMKDGGNGDAGSADFKIASSSLKVAVDSTTADQINVNLEWGTF